MSDGKAIYYDGHQAGYLDAIRMFWDETSGASTDELRALGASLRAAYPRVREAAQARDPVEDVACTGVTARWCPVCGDCNCRPAWDGPTCPLHSSSSPHPR